MEAKRSITEERIRRSFRGRKASNWQHVKRSRQQKKPEKRNKSYSDILFSASPKIQLPKVECVIQSTECFEVKTSIPCVEDAIKSISSAVFHPDQRKWTCSLYHMQALLNKLNQLKDKISVTYPSQIFLSYLLEPPYCKKECIDLSNIDPYLSKNIFPFQKEGILFGISREGRCLIADDMGLGKTVQGLGIAHYFYNDWPCLIVCPASVSYHWLQTIQKWLPSLPRNAAKIIKTEKEPAKFEEGVEIHICSYSIVSKNACILQNKYGVIIVDESHMIKNEEARRTKIIVSKLRKSRRAILLSGTPALSRPAELFTQINAIDPTLFPNYTHFTARYCSNSNFFGFKLKHFGSKNAEELQLILQGTLMMRRLKNEVLSQLPSKIREVIVLDIEDAKLLKKVRRLGDTFKQRDLPQEEKHRIMYKYFLLSGLCKLSSVKEYLINVLANNKKTIIYAHHKKILDEVCKLLEENEIEAVRIDGSTSQVRRPELCEKFQSDEKCVVAVLSITAASLGLTLTACEQVIFTELYWNPSILIQAEDRAHRIGQKNSVLVRYLVAPDTIDHVLWPLLQKKMNILSSVGLSSDDGMACYPQSSNEVDEQSELAECFTFLNKCSASPMSELDTMEFFDSDDDEILMEAFNLVDI